MAGKEEVFRALKERLRQKVSKANKRVDRLEKKGYTGVPAYKQYQDLKNGKRFSSAGADMKELRKEEAKLDKFLGSKTSTVRGANKNMKDMIKRHNIPTGKMTTQALIRVTSHFYELYSKAEQYLKNLGAEYSLDSDQKFADMSEYLEREGIQLDGSENVDEIFNKYKQHLDTTIGVPKTKNRRKSRRGGRMKL